MERRNSLARSTVPELNDGEGVGPSGWGAALVKLWDLRTGREVG
jgi:hypothetical protein